MPEPTRAENPYASPAIDRDSLMMRRRAIQIGRDEVQTIVIDRSLAWGLATHSVDADGNSGPRHRGPCRFQAGQEEVHQIEVELDATHRINLLVDGAVVEANVFPRSRATVFAVVAVLVLVASGAAITLLLSFARSLAAF